MSDEVRKRREAEALRDAVGAYLRELVADPRLDESTRARFEADVAPHAKAFLLGWLEEQGGAVTSDRLLPLLKSEFDDPVALRERLLAREAARSPLGPRSAFGALVLWCLALVSGYALLFLFQWLSPNLRGDASVVVNGLFLSVAPLTGLACHLWIWVRTGNRHHIAPFVLVSVLAFASAACATASLEIVERHPGPRYLITVATALPAVNIEFQPVIVRAACTIDRTGLPSRFTHLRFLNFAFEHSTHGRIIGFWSLVVGVGIANYLIMRHFSADSCPVIVSSR